MKFTQRGFGSAFFCHFKVSNLHKMTRPLNFVIKLSSPNDFFKGCIFALVTVLKGLSVKEDYDYL